MTAPEMGKAFSRAGLALCMAIGAMFVTFTYCPPRFFLFESFANYHYSGEYGILQDYSAYRVFKKSG